MAIACHPYLSGVPHRIGHVRAHLRGNPRRKTASCRWDGEKILDWYLAQQQKAKRDAVASLPLCFRSARSEGADQRRGGRPARGPQRRRQGHVRHRRRAHRLRQSGLAREPAAGDASTAAPVQKLLDAGATIIGKTICDEFFYSVDRRQRPLRHAGECARAGPPARRLVEPDRRPRPRAGALRFRARQRHRRLGAHPRLVQRHLRLCATHERIEHSGVADMAPSFDVPGWFAATPGVFRNVGAVLLDGTPRAGEDRARCRARRRLRAGRCRKSPICCARCSNS